METGIDLPKNRKRGSKKLNEMEETPFTGQHKPVAKSKDVDGTTAKNSTCLRNTQCYFCDFCDNTSIHGFKFLGERRRYFIEKVWWFLVVCGAFTGSAMLISKTYQKWASSPVVVTFAMTETPIWKVPFPAVTICPEVKIKATVFNYTDVYLRNLRDMNTTAEENEYYYLFSLICKTFDEIYFNASEWRTITDEAYYKFLNAFASLDASKCRWLGSEEECDDILSLSITSEGLCRTFNMFDPDDIYRDPDEYIESRTITKHTGARKWSLEDGYPDDADLNFFPRRTILTGASAGLEIDLTVNDDELDYVCSELQGFKVTLHHPAEQPDMDKHFRVPLNQAVIVGIRPRMITTSEEIQNYSPEHRQCYLPGEKLLDTYKIYTQQNCLTECLTNFTVQKCGCTAFYMPYNGEAETCGLGSKSCMKEAKGLKLFVEFLSKEVVSKMNKDEQCGCLPACTSLEFDSETSQTEWEWKKSLSVMMDMSGQDDELNWMHQSKLIVYYKEMQFMTSERHELYGVVDFLANCGGLLGLFCGFSFTSSIEILYYLTLRFACNLKKFGRRVWSGAPELMEEENQ